MKTILQVSCAAFFMTTMIKLHAQAALPYFTGFDNTAQQSGWVAYQKGGMGSGWLYTTTPNKVYSPTTALWQIYSTIADVDDWFVSPDFNLPSGGMIDSVRYMNNGLSTPIVDDTVAIYLLQGSPDPSLATKILLFDIRGADFSNDGIYRKKTNLSLSSFTGKSYIAFRYKCKQFNWLEPYFDNLAISASVSAPVAYFSLNQSAVCKGGSVPLKDLSSNIPTSWSWQIPGGTPSSSTASSLTASYANPGTYTITLTSSNSAGTSSISKTILVSACTDINESQSSNFEVLLYPNPSSNGSELTIQLASEIENAELNLQVYNLLGELVCDKELVSASLNKIYVNLPTGSYVYRLHDKDLVLKSGKLIIE